MEMDSPYLGGFVFFMFSLYVNGCDLMRIFLNINKKKRHTLFANYKITQLKIHKITINAKTRYKK